MVDFLEGLDDELDTMPVKAGGSSGIKVVSALGDPVKRQFEEKCDKCNGTGVWASYSGYTRGRCFACKGAGKKVFSTDAATRQKAREAAAARKTNAAERNVASFAEAHPAEHAWLIASAPSFEFAQSMLDALTKYGQLTEKQLTVVSRLTVQAAERKAARAVEQATRVETAKVVSIEAIETAFGNAKEAGIKFPKLRLDTFVFSPAPETGKNAGAIYIKEDGIYLGKVAGGKLFPVRDCSAEAADRIVAVASDPAAAAIAYGKKFGACSVCNRELSDETSVARGIGPVCAEKFGF
jgi:hypothetical protein